MLDYWFALALLVGPLGLSVFASVVGSSDAVVANAACALVLTAVVFGVRPDASSDPVWRLGLLTVGGFAAGRWVAGRVGVRPTATAVSVAIWVVAVACAWVALALSRRRERARSAGATDRD